MTRISPFIACSNVTFLLCARTKLERFFTWTTSMFATSATKNYLWPNTRFLIHFLVISSVSCSDHQELPSAHDAKFIFVGFRHGFRQPGQFLRNDTSYLQWAWEGANQLTAIGRQQAASLGAFLRQRYNKLVPDKFFPLKVKAYSSSAERCQQTLQSVMLGLYPPVGNNPANWQPVPYEINDPMLRIYNIKCPHYTDVYRPISEDTGKGADVWLNRDPELVQYIAKNSGLNASLSDLADVADNIGNMKAFNVTLPAWITNPTLKGYPPKDMYKAVLSFAEAHQILCANDSDGCASIMAGMWLDHIIQTLNQLKNNTLKGRVAHFYAAHTETVLSLIRLLKAEGVQETPTSSGLILEYTDTPVPAVRFLFHEPDPRDPNVRLAEWKKLPYCDEKWCKLDKFIDAVKNRSFSDWQATCKLPACPL